VPGIEMHTIKMKTITFKTAIILGFDYGNSSFDTREELEQLIVNFLNDNVEKLPKLKDFCEVHQHNHNQHVSYGNFFSSGEIVDWTSHYNRRKHRIYHSSFLHIENDGRCYEMKLYCFSK
jgi:hypothetical protein